MNELLNKILSYNIFNYLFPGIIFSVPASSMINYPVDRLDIIFRLFLYYFVGLVISRFGSLIIEPILKGISLVKFADYADYVKASQKDAKIEVLSEENNTYRTLTALFALLLLLKIYVAIQSSVLLLQNSGGTILAILMLIMFLFSYRKQTAFIVKRIRANL